MRDIPFYIAVFNDDNTRYLPDVCFYTTNKLLMDKFIIQNKDVIFDIYELYGDNIIEVAEEFNKKKEIRSKSITVEINDMLEMYTSKTLPDISFIASENYIAQNIDSHSYLSEDILRILMSSYMNMEQMIPYMRNTKELKDFLQFVFIYITRFIIASNNDIYGLPEPAISRLGLNKCDTFCDIIDEHLLYYMQEYGWGDNRYVE